MARTRDEQIVDQLRGLLHGHESVRLTLQQVEVIERHRHNLPQRILHQLGLNLEQVALVKRIVAGGYLCPSEGQG
jgi:hypothetical protein